MCGNLTLPTGCSYLLVQSRRRISHTLYNEKISRRQITSAQPRRTVDLPINNCQSTFHILKRGKKWETKIHVLDKEFNIIFHTPPNISLVSFRRIVFQRYISYC